MVTLPAPSVNAVENRNLTVLVKSLRNLLPKHQPPKIGHIERLGRMARLKRSSSFSFNPNDSIVFTSENALDIPKRPMAFLTGGHTSVNRWPVQEILEQHPFLCRHQESNPNLR